MQRSIAWLICLAVLTLSPSAHAAEDLKRKVVGVWKLESIVVEGVESKERRNVLGEKPNGYLVITPDRFITVITGQGRKPAQTDDERAALLRSLLAYTGPYTLQGDRLTTKVEVAWNESWVGTDQTRIVRIEAGKLVLESLPAPDATQQMPGLVRGVLTWARSK